MYSAELATCSSEWGKLIDTGVASTDMTLIYNTHGTPEDAEVSVEYVQPDSIVFIEGFSLTKAEADSRDSTFDLSCESYLNILNSIRLQHGKDHPDYRQFKESLLLSIDMVASEYTPAHGSDFTLHTLTEIKGLLQKDCVVFYADYKDFDVEKAEDVERASEYNQQFRTLVQSAETSGLPAITGSSMAGALRDLQSSVRAEILKHDEREAHTVLRSLSAMGRLVELSTEQAALSRNEDGRMIAYTIFGTAHARSLTQQFIDKGMRPTVNVMKSLPEYRYLDALEEHGPGNYRRRIGHAALSAIAYQLTHEFVVPALLEDAYGYLEFLNEADQDECLSFLVSCAHVQKLLGHGDRENAEKEYLALLRSFMPRSTAFKPPKNQPVYAMPPVPES